MGLISMVNEQALHTIQKVLNQLRPAIQGDGGDIELVKYEKEIVYVKLHGACVHCPVSMYTLKLGVEEALKIELPEIKQVVAIE